MQTQAPDLSKVPVEVAGDKTQTPAERRWKIVGQDNKNRSVTVRYEGK